jgi:copper(I)-binding protein
VIAGHPSAGEHRPVPKEIRTGVRVGLTGAVAVLLAACSAVPQDWPSCGQMGVDSRVGDVLLRSVHVVAPSGGHYPAGSDATVLLTLVNESTDVDSLVSVTSPSADRVDIRWDRQCRGTTEVMPSLPLAPESRPDAADAERPFDAYDLRLVGLREDVPSGGTIQLTFTFSRAGWVDTAAEVQPSNAPLPEPSHPCVIATL